jgi:hypothetical protein
MTFLVTVALSTLKFGRQGSLLSASSRLYLSVASFESIPVTILDSRFGPGKVRHCTNFALSGQAYYLAYNFQQAPHHWLPCLSAAVNYSEP